MGIPPGVPVKAAKSIRPCPSYCRADCPGTQPPAHPPGACPGVPAAWRERRSDAQRILKEEFDRDCSLSSTYRLLHRIEIEVVGPASAPRALSTRQRSF